MTTYLISFPSGVMQVAGVSVFARLDGGHTVIEVPTRAEAEEWARRRRLPLPARAARVHVRP